MYERHRPNGLTDAAHPARHLAGRVHVVRLHVLREALLRRQVQLDHGLRERLRVPAQRRLHAQHGARERAVDLRACVLCYIITFTFMLLLIPIYTYTNG